MEKRMIKVDSQGRSGFCEEVKWGLWLYGRD